MIVIRCTHRLTAKAKVTLVENPPAPSAPLGEWYANILNLPFRGKSLVVFVHNPSRLTVAAPGRTLRTTLPVFRERLARLLERMDIPGDRIKKQEKEMSEVVFARTVDRSILGSMTDILHLIQHVAQDAGTPAAFDLDDVEDFLARTPTVVTGTFPSDVVRETLVARVLR